MDNLKDTISAILHTLKAQQSELDRLKAEVASLQTQIHPLLNPEPLQPQPRVPSSRPIIHPHAALPSTRPIYLPELDYLLWITHSREEFRLGTKSGDRVVYKKADYRPGELKIIYGYMLTDNNGTFREYIIPSPTLREDLIFRYGVHYHDDFRFVHTKAMYAKGVDMRTTNGECQGTTSCVVLREPREKQLASRGIHKLIRNTREHWAAQTDEQKRMRIVDEEEMERILSRMGTGTHLPGQGTWCMVEPRDLMAKEDNDANSSYWLSPRKVRLL